MEYRLLGRTGVKVSQLCFGTMTFGKEADKAMSAKLYGRCRDAGINFFDCADVYVGGESERILGGLVRDHRHEVILTSKVFGATSSGINDRGTSRKHIAEAVEGSLSRLGTDYLDLYFLHQFDANTPIEETLRGLEDIVRAGKVLYIGASNFAAWQIMKALAVSDARGWSRFQCIQPMYSLVKRQVEVEILPVAQSEGLGVISYSPLGGGLLTGKYARGAADSDSRLSWNEMYQKRYRFEWMKKAAEQLPEIAAKHGYAPASLAVAWVAENPAITAPIIGARNLDQLNQSLDSLEVEMTPDLYAELTALSLDPPPATDRAEETA